MFAVSSQHLAEASFSSVRKIAVCNGEDREYTEVYKQFSPFLHQNPKNTSLHNIIMEKNEFIARKFIASCILLSF